MKKLILFFSIILFIFSSCKKDDTPTVDVPPTPPAITINSVWQFSVKIDGTIFTAVDSQQNYIGNYSRSGLVNPYPDTSALIYQSGLAVDTSDKISMNIIKSTLRFSDSLSSTIPDSIVFATFFSPASYSYSALSGIIIEWYDANGTKWSTNLGTASQNGSTFKITNILSSYANGYLDVKIKATFNCILYDSTGLSKTLTNGIYVGTFEAN